jgi:membrane protein YdbS with pleckstrin-like domain
VAKIRNLLKKNEEDVVLYSLKKSRRAFLLEYACGTFALMGMTILILSGVHIARFLQYIIIAFAIFAVGSAEINRILERYKITPSKIIITKGILQQRRKSVHFHPLGFVPDINTKQGRIQRLLNYGTVFVSGSGENAFEIKDISHPQKIMRLIEDLIDKNRANSPKDSSKRNK